MENDITKSPFAVTEVDGWSDHGLRGGGKLFALESAAAVMLHLGNYLLTGNKKIRVTIECDPETDQFEFSREVIP